MEKGKSLKSKVPEGECPKCGRQQHHGLCPKCGLCGCSFEPTSSNDYCEDHRPK